MSVFIEKYDEILQRGADYVQRVNGSEAENHIKFAGIVQDHLAKQMQALLSEMQAFEKKIVADELKMQQELDDAFSK